MLLFEVVNLIWSLDLKEIAYETPEMKMDFIIGKDDIGLKKPDFKKGMGNMTKFVPGKDKAAEKTEGSGEEAENNA